jgi:hypothetical protein
VCVESSILDCGMGNFTMERKSGTLSKVICTPHIILLQFFFLWLYSPIQALAASMKLSFSFQLLDLGKSVGLLGRVRPLPVHKTQTLNIRASEASSYFRPLGYCDRLASEREKTVHTLDRSAIVSGTVAVAKRKTYELFHSSFIWRSFHKLRLYSISRDICC